MAFESRKHQARTGFGAVFVLSTGSSHRTAILIRSAVRNMQHPACITQATRPCLRDSAGESPSPGRPKFVNPGSPPQTDLIFCSLWFYERGDVPGTQML